MPLLMCPNCNASMTEVKRNDVAFDMCPSCRGVWLDRGELEKIIAGVHGDSGPAPQQQRSQPQQDYRERRDDSRDRDDNDRHRDGRGRKRGGFDLFDIFD